MDGVPGNLRKACVLSSDRALGKGLRVLGHSIRDEPGLFTVGVAGSILFGALTVGGAFVIGAVVGHVVVPAFRDGHTTTGALLGAAAVLIGLSAARVLAVFGRRLGAGA